MAEILRPIGTVARALDSISNIEFKALDLNRGQYLYLVRVAETPGIILERLAVIVRVDKTTAPGHSETGEERHSGTPPQPH